MIRINKAFTLVELVVTISISSLVLLVTGTVTYFLYRNYNNLINKENALNEALFFEKETINFLDKEKNKYGSLFFDNESSNSSSKNNYQYKLNNNKIYKYILDDNGRYYYLNNEEEQINVTEYNFNLIKEFNAIIDNNINMITFNINYYQNESLVFNYYGEAI